MDERIALVTGSNKGIGFELVRQLARAGVTVILSARSEERGRNAQARLADEGLVVDFHPLDVTEPATIQGMADYIAQRHGRLDILVNNAGILPDEDAGATILNVDPALVLRVFETNTLGSLRVTRQLAPLLQNSGDARVLNVSSGLGQLSDMESAYPAYSVSKTALNAVTRQLASALGSSGVRVNAICPGWVRTDMGGPGAERSPEESVRGIIPLLLDPAEKRTGHFMRDGVDIPW